MSDNEKRINTNWSFNCGACSKLDYGQIEDVVFGCGIIEFLAKHMDWGEGAVELELVLMDDFDSDKWVNIDVDIPESLWDRHEDEINEITDKIESALDDYAGAWNCNC